MKNLEPIWIKHGEIKEPANSTGGGHGIKVREPKQPPLNTASGSCSESLQTTKATQTLRNNINKAPRGTCCSWHTKGFFLENHLFYCSGVRRSAPPGPPELGAELSSLPDVGPMVSGDIQTVS